MKAMRKDKLLVLHLSDIHIRASGSKVSDKYSDIARSINHQLPAVGRVLVAISGDIAWSGKKEEYVLAEIFIDSLKAAIEQGYPDVIVDVVVCPGNHDVDFGRHDEVRDAVLSKIRGEAKFNISDKLIGIATQTQDEFFDFRDRVSTLEVVGEGRISWVHKFVAGEYPVYVRCLNVAWMSEIKESQGALVFPLEVICPVEKKSVRHVAITILHHPFNWYAQSGYHAFKNAVRRESHVVLTGHEHYQSVGENDDIHSSSSVFLEGGVLDGGSEESSSFNMLLIDLSDQRYQAGLFVWDGRGYSLSIDEEEWGSLRPLPVKGTPQLALVEKFRAEINDAGAKFSHPAKKELSLSDFFVWPELRCLDDSALIKRQYNGSYFESMENVGPHGVFIKGAEKSGKTSLLYQYFQGYYGRGFLPLYVSSSWLQRQHARDPLKAIQYALERQYVRAAHRDFLEGGKDRRILLLDDLHRSNLSEEVVSAVLEGLFRYFSGVIVVANDGPEAMDVIGGDNIAPLRQLRNFEIRDFGHKKRYELVRRWVGLGLEEASRNWMGTIDRTEKSLTTAVGRQFVPSRPIFLLTLLQSLEASRSPDLQNSALGHYYQYLITSALESAGLQREQYGEVFNYCSQLAWVMYGSAVKCLSERQLAAFNESYVAEYAPIQVVRRIRDLEKASILCLADEKYCFRYPYLYFMFLGQYIAEHIHENESVAVVAELCQDIHISDNSNILLFVAHHTRSPVVYSEIQRALDLCFHGNKHFDVISDSGLINSLIEQAPQVLFHDDPKIDGREVVRERQDRIDEIDVDSELDSSQDGTDPYADAAAAITRLFKGVEILGQFLKNHYGTTKNQVKNELIDSLMGASLRGLYGFTSTLTEHTDQLAALLARMMEDSGKAVDGDDKKKVAKRLIFEVLGMVAFGFVQKTASSVGSEFLKGNIEEVTRVSGSISYKLIELGFLMDLPQSIPFDRIAALKVDLENNVFGMMLLRSMALRHLHMFKVPYKDKQKLCSELGIELTQQLAVQRGMGGR
jgi:hypothetical protein